MNVVILHEVDHSTVNNLTKHQKNAQRMHFIHSVPDYNPLNSIKNLKVQDIQ